MRPSARVLVTIPMLTFAMLLAPGARADGGNKAAAEALFQEARRAMAAGDYATACARFAESDRLDPAAGTLLNLASCFERSGKTASAWATYREAETLARAAKRPDYVGIAEKRAAALEPKLPRVTVTVTTPTAGLEVKRDGTVVGESEWGLAIPVDPGRHVIEASAPRKRTWSTNIDVGADAGRASVTVPPLEDAPYTPGQAALTSAPLGGPDSMLAADRDRERDAATGRAQRIAAGVVAGAGVVTLGVATAFVFMGKSKYDDSLEHCRDKNTCDAEGASLRDDARADGSVATVLYGAGAVALATGAVLWFTAPRSHASTGATGTARAATATTFHVLPSAGGLVVRGAF